MLYFYLHTPDTVHTLWPCHIIFHCIVFQHESVMLMFVLLLNLAGDLLFLQNTLLWLLKYGCFSYLKVNWFRCLIKDQTRLGGDLFPKDVTDVGMKDLSWMLRFMLICLTSMRLQWLDHTHFVLNEALLFERVAIIIFQIPYHRNHNTVVAKSNGCQR